MDPARRKILSALLVDAFRPRELRRVLSFESTFDRVLDEVDWGQSAAEVVHDFIECLRRRNLLDHDDLRAVLVRERPERQAEIDAVWPARNLGKGPPPWLWAGRPWARVGALAGTVGLVALAGVASWGAPTRIVTAHEARRFGSFEELLADLESGNAPSIASLVDADGSGTPAPPTFDGFMAVRDAALADPPEARDQTFIFFVLENTTPTRAAVRVRVGQGRGRWNGFVEPGETILLPLRVIGRHRGRAGDVGLRVDSAEVRGGFLGMGSLALDVVEQDWKHVQLERLRALPEAPRIGGDGGP